MESKIQIKEIVHLVGIILLGVFFFLGLNYYCVGNLVISILCTVVLLLATMALVNFLVRFKKVTEGYKTNRLFETLVLLLGYVPLACLAFVFYSHFWLIELHQKWSIQETAVEEIREVKNLFNSYREYVNHLVENYEVQLDNVIRKKNDDLSTYVRAGFNSDGGTSSEQKETLTGALRTSLTSSDKYTLSVMEKEAGEWQSEVEGDVEAWNPFTINELLQSIGKQRHTWQQQLTELSRNADNFEKYRNIVKNKDPFQFEYKNNADLSRGLLRIGNMETGIGIWAVVSFVLIEWMVLWVYLFTERQIHEKPKQLLKTDDVEMDR